MPRVFACGRLRDGRGSGEVARVRELDEGFYRGSARSAALACAFAEVFPVFMDALVEHIRWHDGEVLASVFLGDCTLEMTSVASPYRQLWPQVVAWCDAIVAQGDPDDINSIAVDIIENMPWPPAEGNELRAELPPRLAALQ